jgi:hypothetical protein
MQWTSLINSVEPFVLEHRDDNVIYDETSLIFSYPIKYFFPTKNVHKGISFALPLVSHYQNVLGRPAFVYVSNGNTIGPVDQPSAPSPAAAQTADLVTIIWGTPKDESMSTIQNRCEIDIADSVELPSMVVISGLRKWYSGGKLHRKGNYPSLRADYVGASWYQNGIRKRNNGPHTIGIDNYQEFYKDGKYNGYRSGDIHEIWSDNLKDMSGDIHGTVDPLSTEYCHDLQDRFAMMATG